VDHLHRMAQDSEAREKEAEIMIEDYEQDQNRVALLVVMNLFVFTIAAVAIFSILKIAFGAAA